MFSEIFSPYKNVLVALFRKSLLLELFVILHLALFYYLSIIIADKTCDSMGS